MPTSTTNQVADMLVRGGKMSLGYFEALLKGVEPSVFATKIRNNDQVVDAIHPAFAMGHLALYPARAHELIGSDGSAVAPLPGWSDLFAAGAECKDDPGNTIYPPMDEIVSRFKASYESLFSAMASVPDEALAAENPREGRMKELFPTVGGMLNFMCSSHVMMHAGQVSTWRRCMGLPAAM